MGYKACFIFGLGPGKPQRVMSGKDSSGQLYDPTSTCPDEWPRRSWGGALSGVPSTALDFGWDQGGTAVPIGTGSVCGGSALPICNPGKGNCGTGISKCPAAEAGTDVEIWRLATPSA